MTTTEIFLISMTIIFTIPYLIWRLGKTEYYAPLVVVQIITGISLGPGILGSVFPDVACAVDAGAKITMPVADMFWGDRYGVLDNPFGHHWSVATHIRDVSPEEMQQAMQNMGK